MQKRPPRASGKNVNRISQQLAQVKSFLGQGDRPRAERLLERLMTEHPGHFEILSAYGCFLRDSGRASETVQVYRRLLRLTPDSAGHWLDLGVACNDCGDPRAALEAYREAIACDPSQWKAHLNIAYLLQGQKEYEQSEIYYRNCVRIKTDYAPAWSGLGEVCLYLKRPEDAIHCLTEALRLDPSSDTCCNLAQAMLLLGKFEDALQTARKATALNPQMALAHAHAGRALRHLGRLLEAGEAYETALASDPECTSAILGMADIHSNLCNREEALSWYARALKGGPDHNNQNIHSGILFLLTAMPSSRPERLFEEHRRWSQVHGAGVPRCSHNPETEDPARSLRIGFVSGDFRAHAVRQFIAPILAGLDRESFEVICYSNNDRPDSATTALRALADEWRDIYRQEDAQVANQIRSDRIDILVDLSGHTVGSRLLVFERKPAPVQVTYLGYANTTGLATMDYWLTDWVLHPRGTRQQATERIWRLPRCWVAFEPPPDTPEIAPRSGVEQEASGAVTFASFNALWKIGPESIALWGRVLAALPESKLLIKTRCMARPEDKTPLLDWLRSAGVSSDRVTVIGDVLSQAEHLGWYGKCDIALDSTPYSGGTTTAESLWMGVPVVTLPGDLMAGRMSASILHAAGLDEFIAKDQEDFVRIASALARNLAYRSQLRRELRGKVAASSLSNGRDLANEVGNAFRQMWMAWCGPSREQAAL